ncbi:hypothetical protein HELRODRAFT_183654 [Helobdella robusta]|uniref:DNA-directed RNA polymerase III subunit RPC5 n=1 Tax=Helobdella robusta TaxID=6412 RepID=T1FK00_HELRO|nr:hypothetical protein HELRODRAFT_183654 [Helobdella robusta]ESO10432.1 hypothetical protein HELRODRAFT_183654 [Helobdella robusta]
MADVDDDPVVSEINVAISKQTANLLCFLQYPLHSKFVNFDSSSVAGVKVKFQSQKLQIDLKPLSGMFEEKRDWALDGDEENNVNTNRFLKSATPNTNANHFALGCFVDNTFFLNPISTIYELRPNMVDKKKKHSSVENDNDDNTDAEIVTPILKQKETDAAKSKRLASYEHLKNFQDKEAWVSLDLYTMSENEFQNSFSSRLKTNPISEFYMTAFEYVNTLAGVEDVKSEFRLENCAQHQTVEKLKSFKLNEQVKLVMEWSKVISFKQIISLLPEVQSVDDLLKHLQQVAILIQGNWVIKSDLLFGNHQSCQTLRAIRDFILYQFAHDNKITRAEVNKFFGLTEVDENLILYDISEMCVGSKKWKFCVERDDDFIARFSEIAERQLLLINRRYQQIKNSYFHQK